MAKNKKKSTPTKRKRKGGGGGLSLPAKLLAVAAAAAAVLGGLNLAKLMKLFDQSAALAARDRAAFGAVGPPKPNPNGFDRSIAWCSQQWGDDMKALGEHMLERYQADPKDASAATTLGNLMVRATEGHMRSSNWSATSAIAAPSSLSSKYSDVLKAAVGLFHGAAQPRNGSLGHHGAHYSLALVYKLYPLLVDEPEREQALAAAAAARLCEAERNVISHIAPDVEYGLIAAKSNIRPDKGSAAGRLAAKAAPGCSSFRVVTDWRGEDRISLTPIFGDVHVAEVRPPENKSLFVTGLDATLHDFPMPPPPPPKDNYRKPPGPGYPTECRVFGQSAGCYPALWRQFGGSAPLDGSDERELVLNEAALADGFSGASYYHWLCETVPRLLVLSDELKKRSLDTKVPLLLPNDGGGAGGKFIADTLRLLGREAFAPFGALHKREHSLQVRVQKKIYAVWWPTNGHRGGSSALKTPAPLLRRVRAAVVAAAAAEADKPPRPPMSTIVLVARRANESRALGNQEAITAALAAVAGPRNLDFALFDGEAGDVASAARLFGSAALVVGVHGAGLANALFCAAGAAVLELSLPEPEFGEYKHLAEALDLKYAASPLPHSNYEARAWPKPSSVAAAAVALLDTGK